MAEDKRVVEEKKEEKVIEAVAKGKKREKKFGQKLKESFIAEEALDFKDYLLKDLIVPIIKDAICDGITNGLSMLFYGEQADYRRRSGRRDSSTRRTDYRSSYNYRDDRDRDERRRARHSSYDFELIECETKSEAMDILDNMHAVLDKYGSVSIADMYDLAGISRNPEDNNYGWTNLAQAKIVRESDGIYVINMPRAKSLK